MSDARPDDKLVRKERRGLFKQFAVEWSWQSVSSGNPLLQGFSGDTGANFSKRVGSRQLHAKIVIVKRLDQSGHGYLGSGVKLSE